MRKIIHVQLNFELSTKREIKLFLKKVKAWRMKNVLKDIEVTMEVETK